MKHCLCLLDAVSSVGICVLSAALQRANKPGRKNKGKVAMLGTDWGAKPNAMLSSLQLFELGLKRNFTFA